MFYGESVAEFNTLADIVKLPTNIATYYPQFTADEWKNFVIFYNLFLLRGLLPIGHMRMLQKIVLACRELCQPTMRIILLSIADTIIFLLQIY